jgi:hypothetical protein
MLTIEEFIKAAKEVRDLREKLNAKEIEFKSLRDGLSDDDKELLGLNGQTESRGKGRTRMATNEVMKEIRLAFKNKAKLTRTEIQRALGYNAGRIHNAIYRMRQAGELEAVAADEAETKSTRNTAYKLVTKRK